MNSSKDNQQIPLGSYKHFKGGEVEVIGVATHSETMEEMVVYRHTEPGGPTGLWVRPRKMFLEEIEVDGKRVKRFTHILA